MKKVHFKNIGKLESPYSIIYWLPGAPAFTAQYKTKKALDYEVRKCLKYGLIRDDCRGVAPIRFFATKQISPIYHLADETISQKTLYQTREKDRSSAEKRFVKVRKGQSAF